MNMQYPRSFVWISESLRTARSHPGPPLTAGIVIAIVCVIVVLTTGQTVAAEQNVLGRLDSMGTRVVSVSDDAGDAGMRAISATAVSSLESADWSLALGEVRDMKNANGPMESGGVPARLGYGDIKSTMELTVGRWPAPGEAIVSEKAAQQLQLKDGVGGVIDRDGATFAVVGTYSNSTKLSVFDELILIVPEEDSTSDTILYLYSETTEIEHVDALVTAIENTLTASNPGGLTIESPDELLTARSNIASDLGTSSRVLMLGALIVGLVLVMVTMFAATSERKTDFGRRRALGASRMAIIAMVSIHAVLAAVFGVVLGMICGLTISGLTSGVQPPVSFLTAVGLLCIITTVIASMPPAVVAARRDPVRILRVP